MKLRTILSLAGITALATVALALARLPQTHQTLVLQKRIKRNYRNGNCWDYQTFSYRDENGELTGFDIELARAIFDGSDQYELTFETTDGSGQFLA